MFENGNYRRRRRMKRPYRTGAHFQKMLSESYNFSHRVFPQPYQTYPPRYDTGLVKIKEEIKLYSLIRILILINK
jgi:forkhead box protein L